MPPARSERRPRSLPLWRRARRVLLLASCICLIPAALSWVDALSAPRNVSLGVASVEWLRQNGGNSLVSQIENEYYTLTAPSKGGPPLHSLPQVGVAAAAEGEAGATRPTVPPTWCR